MQQQNNKTPTTTKQTTNKKTNTPFDSILYKNGTFDERKSKPLYEFT